MYRLVMSIALAVKPSSAHAARMGYAKRKPTERYKSILEYVWLVSK